MAKFRLSPAQQEAIGCSTKSLNIWYGSVSSGKTTAWLLLMLGAIKQAGDSGAIVIMGQSADAIWRNVFVPLLNDPIFSGARPYIKYRQRQGTAKIFGKEVYVIGVSDIGAERRIRGGTFQLVFYDELTLCPEPVFNMLWSRMRATGNPIPPRIYATTNPAHASHYLKARFIDRPVATDTYSKLFTMDDNPALSDAYRARTKASYSGLFYKRFIQGLWVATEGAVYEGWDDELMVVDKLPELLEVIAVGVDYGTIHPSAGYALCLGIDGRLYVTNEWVPNEVKGSLRKLTDAQLADSFQQWLTTLPTSPRFVYIDPAAASFAQELRHRGMSVAKADNAVLDGIRTVDSLLVGSQMKIHSQCVRLIHEIPSYRWDAKASEKGMDKVMKVNDDHVDALRYAVYSSRHLWRRHVVA